MIKPTYKLDIFPFRRTLKKYSKAIFYADVKAGANVALLEFPQAMAYALLAGFPVAFGLYASAVGCIIGPLLASSRYIILGPTNATSIMVLSTFLALNFDDAEKLIALPLLLLMTGVFMMIGATLKVAGMIKYISQSVLVGYITAAALLIIIHQVDIILGSPRVHAVTFFEVILENLYQWDQVQWQSIAVGLFTLLTYLVVKRWLDRWPTIAATLAIVSLSIYFLKDFGLSIDLIESLNSRLLSYELSQT